MTEQKLTGQLEKLDSDGLPSIGTYLSEGDPYYW